MPRSNPPGSQDSWGWTRRQRIGLGVLVAILIGLLAVQAIRRPYRLDDSLVITSGGRVTLPTSIDPNTADAASLSRIPGVSESMAGAIVEFREIHRTDTPEGVVFQNFEDLARVPKLRKKTLESLRVALVFPGDATRPAPSPHGLTPAARVGTTEAEDEITD